MALLLLTELKITKPGGQAMKFQLLVRLKQKDAILRPAWVSHQTL